MCRQPVQVPLPEEPDEVDAPPQMLELQEREEDKEKKGKPQAPIGGVRSKKGFGRAVVGPGMRPRRFSADPGEKAHKRRNVAQGVLFALLAAGIGLGAFVWYKSAKPKVDPLDSVKAQAERYVRAYISKDAAALAAFHHKPEERPAVQAYFTEAFSKIQVNVADYKVFAYSWSTGTLRLRSEVVWNVEYTDLATGKTHQRSGQKVALFWRQQPDQSYLAERPLPIPADIYSTPAPGY